MRVLVVPGFFIFASKAAVAPEARLTIIPKAAVELVTISLTPAAGGRSMAYIPHFRAVPALR